MSSTYYHLLLPGHGLLVQSTPVLEMVPVEQKMSPGLGTGLLTQQQSQRTEREVANKKNKKKTFYRKKIKIIKHFPDTVVLWGGHTPVLDLWEPEGEGWSDLEEWNCCHLTCWEIQSTRCPCGLHSPNTPGCRTGSCRTRRRSYPGCPGTGEPGRINIGVCCSDRDPSQLPPLDTRLISTYSQILGFFEIFI